MQGAPTATKATQVQDASREAAGTKLLPSLWKLSIQARWVAV